MYMFITVMHQQWSKPNPLVPRNIGSPRDGLLALVDWTTGKVVWQMPGDSPAGLCFRDDYMSVASMAGQYLTVYNRELEVERVIANTLFNDLHTVTPTRAGVLIASSGVDGLLECDESGTILWEWLATEHGFDRLSDGRRRVLDKRVDYHKMGQLTSDQTTHVNSARAIDDKAVAATLFAQGAVILIDKETGGCRRIVDGLDRPHAFRPRPGGYSVCDTASNAVVLLDQEFAIDRIYEGRFDWVQDAIVTEEDVFVLDANNMCIVRLCNSNGAIRHVVQLPTSWKGFGLEIVPPEWESMARRLGAKGVEVGGQ